MRSLILLLLSVYALSGAAFAQSGAIQDICEDCRDPLEHPDDWTNFAFNQIYGDEGWMDFDQADDFWIQNLEGDRVYVDVDYVMEGINVFGNELPLWPTNMLQFTLALPNGQILVQLRSIFMTPLPVPSSPPPHAGPDSPSPSGDGGESGNDGVDEPEPGENEEPAEPPEIEIVGTTGIEDPDEDGEFPEPEWCEEC